MDRWNMARILQNMIDEAEENYAYVSAALLHPRNNPQIAQRRDDIDEAVALKASLDAEILADEEYLDRVAAILREAFPQLAESAQAPEALAVFLARQIEWSTQTFGTARRTLGITKHIEKEIVEVRAKPDDLTEWIDIIILALDGYWRHGGKPETILCDLNAKAEINYGRVYPMPTSEDEPSEHIRGDQPKGEPHA